MTASVRIQDRTIRGLLIDLDGVLYVGSKAIAGAVAKVDELGRIEFPHLYVTNTTTHSRDALAAKLAALGFRIAPDKIMTAPLAAKQYLERKGKPPLKLLLRDEVKGEFEGFEQSDTDARAVVVGDIGSAWTYELLNQVFRLVMNGAELIALHKNKFWQTEHGLQLDIGAFVAGLEYCTGKRAVIAGKPNVEFFRAAVEHLGMPVREVAMIGDDIESDVAGAQAQGLAGILVRTGKYRKGFAEASGVRPDLVLDSFRDLLLVEP